MEDSGGKVRGGTSFFPFYPEFISQDIQENHIDEIWIPVLFGGAMRALIFANQSISPSTRIHSCITPDTIILAADGGAEHLLSYKLRPHAVIGDFDSLSPECMEGFSKKNVRFYRHPAQKDETDLELALSYAVQKGADDILVFGATGGRWDMSIANFLLPAILPSHIRTRFIDGNTEIQIIRGPAEVHLFGEKGDTLSLIPLDGDTEKVSLSGLLYGLSETDLLFGKTRGISNAFIEKEIKVIFQKGLLMIVHIRGN